MILYLHRPCCALRRFYLLRGAIQAYHVPQRYLSGLGLAYPPVALRLRQVMQKHLCLATYRFGQSEISIFRSLDLTTFKLAIHIC